MDDNMENKFNAVLNNPELMQKIMSMAQSLGQNNQENQSEQDRSNQMALDPQMLKNLSGLTQLGGIDRQQQALLSALSPYLRKDRISKLENAMRAAKITKMASALFRSGAIPNK